MSEIGGSEVLLLIIIGLIVLGPERLPRVANQIGSWLGQARRMTRMMRRQLEEEVNFDLKKEVGLDQAAKSATDQYRNPEFVQDRHTDQPNDDETNVELPDDYSPAHGADERGTGVGDDPLDSTSATTETAATADSEPQTVADATPNSSDTEAASEQPKTRSA
ncbi:MAG: Sec-independent protein translocase protein TatB [Pseudomonadota bacterium]